MKILFAIAVGGAVGALGRHSVDMLTLRWLGAGFPYGTLTVNVLGSFLMGALIEVMALRWSVGPEVRALLSVGVLGGFTTFSTFSLDFVVLVERGQLGTALGYAALSFSLSILGLFAGLWLFRTILA